MVSSSHLSPARKAVASLVEGRAATSFITALILVNAVTLGMETDASWQASYGPFLYWVDKAILVVFTIELALKFFAYRLYFSFGTYNRVGTNSGALAVLRALRILRVLRLISVVPQMRRVVAALAIPFRVWFRQGVGAHFLCVRCAGDQIVALICKNGSVLLAPQPYHFQIMTLESWSMGVASNHAALPLGMGLLPAFYHHQSFAVLNFCLVSL